jgi:hypothetical protein
MRRTNGALLSLLLAVLATAGWTTTPGGSEGAQVFTGEISDTICAHYKGHKHMMEEVKGMGNDKKACIAHCREQLGASYVLYDPAKDITYQIADQDKVAAFSGQKVRISGTADKNKKLKVTRVEAAN